MLPKSSRREFIAKTVLAATVATVPGWTTAGAENLSDAALLKILPRGPTPAPVPLPHFPDRLHAFVWRNWGLVPVAKLALVVGTNVGKIETLATAMGLPRNPRITSNQQRRSYITVIKRNWHPLPYQQLLDLLEWDAERLAYTLREDDFLFQKLGGLKPECPPLRYELPNATARAAEQRISRIFQEELGGLREPGEPLFTFVKELSEPPSKSGAKNRSTSPRFCYSYFALYGDPLLEPDADPYPDGYLARLAEAGVNGVWLQAVLYKLAPFPWQPELSAGHEIRLRNLEKLIARARKQGIGIYLYLNEPRSLPLRFFESHPELKGVIEGEHAALCTSQGSVRDYLRSSVATICRAAPDLAGFFTITASENLTNCWSHGAGAACLRCTKRSAAEVIAEVNTTVVEGIRQAATKTRLLAWDWGWANTWAEEAISRLPKEAMLMSVSEWDLPIKRGGVSTTVGEYSISAVGPGPRAQRHWALAKKAGLQTIAKIQAGNTWELSAVPYIPAVRNVAEHAAKLRKQGVDGVMLGWTLGGYPSPNLEVIEAVDQAAGKVEEPALVIDEALKTVAERRFGKEAAPHVVEAWNHFSRAFSQFPYEIGVVYSAPLQLGPANLLWSQPTGYQATMVGFPYDDLNRWRADYPPETFAAQLETVADGFRSAIKRLTESTEGLRLSRPAREALGGELRVAEAAEIHFRSTANQARFVMQRKVLSTTADESASGISLASLETIIRNELQLARRLYRLQLQDSRIGFEASNQYYYVPIDLAEKVLNCRDLLDRVLPEERKKRRA